jgi:hypothetical protein
MRTDAFVRGGEANETLNFIDGIVAQPTMQLLVMYLLWAIFSLLFSGIAFSTGGYSCRIWRTSSVLF